MWLGAGLVLLLGVPAMPVLLVAAVPVGFANGLMAVLRPILATCYFGSEHMSHAVADMSVVVGLTWVLGALAGGWVLSSVALGWGLVVFGVLACSAVLGGTTAAFTVLLSGVGAIVLGSSVARVSGRAGAVRG